MTITAVNQTKVYGAALPTLTASYSGFVNGDTSAKLTTQPTLTTTATVGSHVSGSPYSITASGATDPDYAISYVAGTLTVTTAPLTITAVNQTKVYGAALPTLTASYSGFVNGDRLVKLTTLPTLTTTATASSHVVGSPYAITASGATDPDYAISYVAGTLTVTTAPLTITAVNQTKVYGAALPTLTASYSGFVNGDRLVKLTTLPTLTTTATASSHVVGSPYAITASGATDPDYAISYVAGTLTVTTAPLTITAVNQTKVYGAALPTLTASYSGFVNGDTSASLTTLPTLTTTATVGSHVSGSPYAITASEAADPDYNTQYVSGTMTVTPAPLTITADSQTMVYGTALPTLTASYSGFVNGDGEASLTTPVTLSTTATASSHVAGSPYRITASEAAGSNYTITYVTGTLAVTPASLTITADNKFKSDGAPLPTLTSTSTGLVDGDSLTTQPTLSTDATAASPLGTYTITISGAAASSDYKTTPANGTLTVITDDTVGGYDSTTSRFLLSDSNTTGMATTDVLYGVPNTGLIPLVGDWTGNGMDTIGLYDPTTSVFYLRNSNSSGMADTVVCFGAAGCGFTPIVGDWDGKGTDTVGLYDPTNSVFYLRDSNTSGMADTVVVYGPAQTAGLTPVVGDWNGNGMDTVGLYNSTTSVFYLRCSNTTGCADIPAFTFGVGNSGEKPLVGDWSGTGKDTMGMYDSATSLLYLRCSNTTGDADIPTFVYGPAGTATWTPLVGHWTGDGQALATEVASTQATGTYGVGTEVPIAVTFSEPVTVTGTPQLALNAGSGAVANYAGGSGTSALAFTYTVAAGQQSSDLDYASTAALALNGGSIQDPAGNAAVLTLPTIGTDGLANQNITINTQTQSTSSAVLQPSLAAVDAAISQNNDWLST